MPPRQVRLPRALLALPLVAMCACGAPDGAPSDDDARAATDGDAALERAALRPGRYDRLLSDARELEGAELFHFDVEDGDVSVLLSLALAHGDDGIGITRVTAPDGTVVHETRFEDDSWEAVRSESRIAVGPIVGTGDLALFLPSSPEEPLESGRWTVDYETDPPDAAFAHATRTVRRDSTGAVADGRAHVVDVYLHVLHPDERYRDPGFADALERDWRPALDRVLAPHALGIGRMTFGVASVRETSRLAEIDDEREAAEACRLVRRHGPPPDEESGAPALHVGFVAAIAGDLAWSPETDVVVDRVDGTGDADPRVDPDGRSDPGDPEAGDGEDADAEAERHDVDPDGEWHDDDGPDGGALTGLSPQPGLPFDDESPNACVFVAERPWREGYAAGDAPDEATVVELLAANLLHELGHFASLAHPSETDGRTFDLLDDTPRCTEPDADACGVAGGADNLMFHSGDESTMPWTLTADQAWVLRRHPLFRPAEP